MENIYVESTEGTLGGSKGADPAWEGREEGRFKVPLLKILSEKELMGEAALS